LLHSNPNIVTNPQDITTNNITKITHSPYTRRSPLECIIETLSTLINPLPFSCELVAVIEHISVDSEEDDHQELAGQSSPDTRNISGRRTRRRKRINQGKHKKQIEGLLTEGSPFGGTPRLRKFH
jgi:hypothetical protein